MLWMLRQVYYIHENTKQSSFLAYLLVPTGSQIILVGILFFSNGTNLASFQVISIV